MTEIPDEQEDPRKYKRTADHVRELIMNGTIGPGSPAPSIAVLVREFGGARQTHAKALRLLVDEGLLTRFPGLGYYVVDETALAAARRAGAGQGQQP